MKKEEPTKQKPPQTQTPPGKQKEMVPEPQTEGQEKGSGQLEGKVAIITGGDSGIGQAVAIAFAKEGANIVIVYLKEHEDANEAKKKIEQHGRKCLLIDGDIGQEKFCLTVVEKTLSEFKKIDILVNNAAEQHPQENIENISEKQLEKTFRTNIFSFFFLTKAALKSLEQSKGTIINTSSVTAYRGSENLIDYSATKGAIVAFTRSLALNLIKKGIRVNGVAPGPIWTPLITSTFPKEKVETFGSDVPMKRAGEPAEVAPCYVFLASNASSYMTGQFLHPNGGEIVNT